MRSYGTKNAYCSYVRRIMIAEHRTGIALTLCLCWLCSAEAISSAQEPARPSRGPLWSAEVLQQDMNPADPFSTKIIDRSRAGLCFLDTKRLIVYELVLKGGLSSRKTPVILNAFRLQMKVLDASSGKEIFQKEWPARVQDSYIHAVSGGVLVRTEGILRIYGKDFQEIRQMPLLETQGPYEWMVIVSPSGETVLVNQISAEFSSLTVMDGQTFELKKSWRNSPALRFRYTISDHGLAAWDGSHIIISRFGAKWTTLRPKLARNCHFTTPTLVANDAVVYPECRGVSLITADGQVRARHFLGGKERPDQEIAVAEDGELVAASLANVKVTGPIYDDSHKPVLIGRRVAVYNLLLNKLLSDIEVVPLPKARLDFALSLDGSRLAILNDKKVSVYDIPAN